MDAAHNLSCVTCHEGDNTVSDKNLAHETATAKPAHPDTMLKTCGSCHEELVKKAQQSLHFTLKNEVNTVRKAFGSLTVLESLKEIPDDNFPATALGLVDDLLRRRCLRCHPYYSGDAYGSIIHGTGCAACHLDYQEGQLSSHQFIAKPNDKQCLSCHYGNYVGADYYGKFEQDFNWDYWTPFTADGEQERPYGVAQHALRPDIHLLKGLSCIDCHSGAALKSNGETQITCSSCHLWDQQAQSIPLNNLTVKDNTLILTTKLTNKKIVVPQLTHPAHQQYIKSVGCQVCHAQWSFADKGIHLFRQDDNDYELWQALTRQGSSEVEFQLEANLFQGNDQSDAFMADKISGHFKIGLWLKGYELRRWEEIETCRDAQGMIQVCRSPHNLHLTYVNLDGDLIFDSIGITSETPDKIPYVPHTTGKAGPFFVNRINKINSTANQTKLDMPINSSKEH